MRARLAGPLALLATAAAFAGTFALTRSLLWSPILALLVGLGGYLLLDDRTEHQVRRDSYADDANRKAAEALRLVDEIRRLGREVENASARSALETACGYVPELLTRIRANSPDSLYSSASQLGAHLASLRGVVTQYLDIQRKPQLYADPAALRRGGELAFQRFAEFAFDNVQLVNQGDIARYRANLETVAPPKLPELDG